MPIALTGQPEVARKIKMITPTTKAVSINSSYLFYSNNPEYVSLSDCADRTRFLYRDTVTGAGQVYTWHNNNTGKALTTSLLIYNYNAFAVTVTASNYGLSNNVSNDAAAWKSYFDGNNISISVPAGGYNNLFKRTVSNGNNWGVVSRLSIKNCSTGAAAGAILFDLAYVDSSFAGNATTFAAAVRNNELKRGKGSGYFTNLYCTLPITATTGDGVRVNFGSKSDSSFSGNECVTLVDTSGASSGQLLGAFGQQMNITVTIKNQTGAARKFRIYLGCNAGGNPSPVYSYGGTNVSCGSTASGKYRDIIESDSIACNDSATLSFFSALPGGTNTPYSFGVRPI